MKFGVQLMYERLSEPEFLAGAGQLVEQLGFDSLWLADHVVVPSRYASVYPYNAAGRVAVGPVPRAVDLARPARWLDRADRARNRSVGVAAAEPHPARQASRHPRCPCSRSGATRHRRWLAARGVRGARRAV